MSRSGGLTEQLAAGLEPIEPLLALATQLGDIWFLVVVSVWLYWFGPDTSLTGWTRRRGLAVLAAALWIFALTYVLKSALALPRPPGAETAAWSFPGLFGTVYADAATATGAGFPSGHASGAAAVYGTIGLFGIVDGSGRWRRAGLRRATSRTWATAVVIGLISLTRLGLGVHYLVDVVVGAALGLAVAVLAVRLVARPGLLFGLAVATAALSPMTGGVHPTSVALLGVSAGALAAWWLVHPCGDGTDRPTSRTAGLVFVAGGVCLAGAATLALAGVLTAGVGMAALGAGLLTVALPAVSMPAVGLPVAWRGGEK